MRRRLALALPIALTALLVLAPMALGLDRVDGGEGTYGETNDKVVTNAGFILIAFFPTLILLLSLLQWRLDKRKEARKKAAKATARPRRALGRLVAGFSASSHRRRMCAPTFGAHEIPPRRYGTAPHLPARGRTRLRVSVMPDEVRYERVGAAAVLTIDRPERRNAVDGPTAEAAEGGLRGFEADDERAGARPHRRGRRRVLRGRRPQGASTPSTRIARPRAARWASPADAVQADDRGDRRAGAWPAGSSWRCGATCGSPPRARRSASPSAAGACR